MSVAGLLLRQLGDHRLGRDQKTGDGSGILQRAAHDLGGVDDALGDEIAIGAGLGIVAEAYMRFSRILPTITEPSSPALVKIWRDGACSALRTMRMPVF